MMIKRGHYTPLFEVPQDTTKIELILRYDYAVYKCTYHECGGYITLTEIKKIYEDVKGRAEPEHLAKLLEKNIFCGSYMRTLPYDITYITGTVYYKDPIETIEKRLHDHNKYNTLEARDSVYLFHTIYSLITGKDCTLPHIDEDEILRSLLLLFNEDQINELLCICHSNENLRKVVSDCIDQD